MSDANLIYTTAANAPFGAAIANINSVTYRANGWSPKSNNREIWRTDTLGDKSDLQIRKEPLTLSATLQLANASTALPPEGTTFTDPKNNAITWIISKVSPSYPAGDYWVVDIECTQPAVAPSSGT